MRDLGCHMVQVEMRWNKSYKKLAKLIHPDKCIAPGTTEAFKLLVQAKDSLIKDAK